MDHRRIGRLALIPISVLLALMGCGGGSSETPSHQELVIGKFIDDPVQGLSYTCSSGLTNTTDQNGLYTCDIGDQVTFKIGSALIGTMTARETFITPYDLFEDETSAINLARLLQSLDADGDQDNGSIIINAADVDTLPADLDFSSDTLEETVFSAANIALIDALQAKRHLDDVITLANGGDIETQDDLHADAGRLQNIKTGSDVTLDGSSSRFEGSEGELTYAWEFVTIPVGSIATLSDDTLVAPKFTADLDGRYVLQLTVTHQENNATDSVVITAATANSAPVANAGSDQYVKTASTVTLDGRRSTDADDDTLSYQWGFATKVIGSSAELQDFTTLTPSFTPDRDGSYVIDLWVNDGTVDSIIDKVSVTASSGNSRPVANAGVNQEVSVNDAVLLDGSRSSDADEDTLTYRWVFTSRAPGSLAVLSDPTAVSPTFNADQIGTYVLHLSVSDAEVESSADKVTITASE